MSARPDGNLTPSVEEFSGWYNIAEPYDDGLPVLHSVEPVPEFWHAEFLKLYFKAARWFDKLVPAPANVPFDPLADPPFYVRSDADDRTFAVDADFQCLTPALLRRIQKDFLGRQPLWRVILVAEHLSCSIAIYPTAIRFGNLPVDVDPQQALSELVPRNLALREARERPKREHIARMRRLLPNAVRATGERPFLVAGVLDNYEGDYSRLTICLLVRGCDRDAVLVERPPGQPLDFLWRDSPYGVDEQGTMISYIEVPESAPFCLVPWLPPADYRGPLTITEEKTGMRHAFELKSQNIIRTTAEG